MKKKTTTLVAIAILALAIIVAVIIISYQQALQLSPEPVQVSRSIQSTATQLFVTISITSDKRLIAIQEYLPDNVFPINPKISEEYEVFSFNSNENTWVIGDTKKTINAEITYTIQSQQDYPGKYLYYENDILTTRCTQGTTCAEADSFLLFNLNFENSLQDDLANYNAVCVGGCPESFTSGNDGQALSLNGNNDYLNIQDLSDINDKFSISLWVNPTTTRDGQAFLGKHSSSGGNRVIFGFYRGKYFFYLRGHVLKVGTKTTGWQHLVVTVNGKSSSKSRVTIYKDGAQIGAGNFGRVAGDLSGGLPWTIGQEWDRGITGPRNSDFFGGQVDDVKIYNKVLSQEEVQQLYNK